MNAANEIAVAAFLDRQVRFQQIWHVVEEVMNRHTAIAHPNLDAILEADQWARNEAQGCVKSLSR
jgi:1-deoxy-D-xylulose-5-phosphate reductoisomerase